MHNTIFFGKVAIRLPVVGSTNEYAKEYLAKSNPIEGTAIYADEQTAGKGQLGSKWQSSARQNVLLSLILYPKFLSADAFFGLNQCICLGIYDALLPFLKQPEELRIKWPNDIYVGKKKMGGVLIENSLKGDWLQSSVVGMGINVKQTKFDVALPNPTSLALEMAAEDCPEVETVLEALYAAMEPWYLALRAGQREKIGEQYCRHLYQRDVWAWYQAADLTPPFEGRIEGVDKHGNLRIESRAGLIRSFGVKKLHFL